MTTTFYLESTAYTLALPDYFAGSWNNTSSAGNYFASSIKKNSAVLTKSASVSYNYGSSLAFGRFISPPLLEGQTITGGQNISCIIAFSRGSSYTAYMRWHITVWDSTRTTIRKTIVQYKSDDLGLGQSLLSRYDSTTSSTGDYITQEGDILVFEVGMQSSYYYGIGGYTRFGSSSDRNYTIDDEYAVYNPTIIFGTDNLLFGDLSSSPSISLSASFSPSASTSSSESPSASSSVSPSKSPSASISPSSSISPSTSVSPSKSPSSSASPSPSPSTAPPTVFYLESTAFAPITPTPTGWTNVSQFSRYLAETSKNSSAMTTVDITDTSVKQEDILVGQWFSHALNSGQTITGGQSVNLIIRASETSANCNLHVAWGIYIYNQNVLKKTIVEKRSDIYEVSVGNLGSKSDTVTSSAGNYITIENDRFVIEIGLEGDPISGSYHTGSLSFGSDSSLDLSSAGISAPNNPIVSFSLDSYTFTTSSNSASLSPSKSESPSKSPSSSISSSISVSPSVSPTPSRSVSSSVSPSISASGPPPPTITINTPEATRTLDTTPALSFSGTGEDALPLEYRIRISNHNTFTNYYSKFNNLSIAPAEPIQQGKGCDIYEDKMIFCGRDRFSNNYVWFFDGYVWSSINPNNSNYNGVALTQYGIWLFERGMSSGAIWYRDYGATSWTTFTGAGNRYWSLEGYGGSAHGHNAFAAGDNGSSTSARLWSFRDGIWKNELPDGINRDGYWYCTAIYENTMLAGEMGGRLWYFDGNSWTETRPIGDVNGNWFTVSLQNGKMTATETTGRVYYHDGNSWSILPTPGILAKSWVVDLNRDGVTLIASEYNGKVYYYDGATWLDLPITEIGTSQWANVAIDLDNKMVSGNTAIRWGDSTFTYQIHDSTTDAGFANITTPADTHPFNDGDTIEYTVQSPLPLGIHYYSVAGMAPSGWNLWSSYTGARYLKLITSSPSISPSISPSFSLSPSGSFSPSGSSSYSNSPSTSASVSPSQSPSGSFSPSSSESPSRSPSSSLSPSASLSPSSSLSPSKSLSPSRSESPSISISESPSLSPSLSPSSSLSPSLSISVSESVSVSPSISLSTSPSTSISPSISPSYSISPSFSESPSVSPSLIVGYPLMRWDGNQWIKSLLKVYVGSSWQTKPMKVYLNGQWEDVDTSG